MNNLIYNMLSHEDNNKFRRCKIIYNTVYFLDAEQVYNRPLLPLLGPSLEWAAFSEIFDLA